MCLMPGTATRAALVTKGGAELVSSAITPRTISSPTRAAVTTSLSSGQGALPPKLYF